jgi:hypothetical protein
MCDSMPPAAGGSSEPRLAPHSYSALKRAPTSRAASAHYSVSMNDGVIFADVELPFHVWVRESTGANGYRWVLRQAPRRDNPGEAISDPGLASGDEADSSS